MICFRLCCGGHIQCIVKPNMTMYGNFSQPLKITLETTSHKDHIVEKRFLDCALRSAHIFSYGNEKTENHQRLRPFLPSGYDQGAIQYHILTVASIVATQARVKYHSCLNHRCSYIILYQRSVCMYILTSTKRNSDTWTSQIQKDRFIGQDRHILVYTIRMLKQWAPFSISNNRFLII